MATDFIVLGDHLILVYLPYCYKLMLHCFIVILSDIRIVFHINNLITYEQTVDDMI